MMKNTPYLIAELFLLFIVMPTSFALDYSVWIKIPLALSGFVYIVFILKRVERISFRVKRAMDWKGFWKRMLVTGIVVISVTTTYVLYKDASALFFVPKNHPLLFIGILFVYSLLSVWPQEVIYRTFFFRRYESLFRSKSLFIFVNAVLFSLAHLFFKNTLVLILTFFGGLLFASTFLKFRSTTMVSIEHALYGNWLFTVGMGQMLAFPGMEAPQ
jgi:hypothetical protein